jgi:hypothetical protein
MIDCTGFPPGSIWQDDSSLGRDGLVDMYVMVYEWEYMGRFPAYTFLGVTRHDH